MPEIIYPLWRQRLVKSLHLNRNQMHAQFYQVASVCPNGRPKNRTMVFRGFLPRTQSLLSVTDLRSEKITQWQVDGKSYFEICWYFSDSREQYRLAGEVTLVSNSLDFNTNESVSAESSKQSLLKQQWANLSTNAKQAFYSSMPKAPFDQEATSAILQGNAVIQPSNDNTGLDITSSEFNTVAAGNLDISDHFCVVIFRPNTVDYLDLKTTPQHRCLYDTHNDWQELIVNP